MVRSELTLWEVNRDSNEVIPCIVGPKTFEVLKFGSIETGKDRDVDYDIDVVKVDRNSRNKFIESNIEIGGEIYKEKGFEILNYLISTNSSVNESFDRKFKCQLKVKLKNNIIKEYNFENVYIKKFYKTYKTEGHNKYSLYLIIDNSFENTYEVRQIED